MDMDCNNKDKNIFERDKKRIILKNNFKNNFIIKITSIFL